MGIGASDPLPGTHASGRGSKRVGKVAEETVNPLITIRMVARSEKKKEDDGRES